MSGIPDLHQLLAAVQTNGVDMADTNVAAAAQLKAVLQHVRNQQLVEHVEQTVRRQQPQTNTDSLLSRLSQLNQLFANQEGARNQQPAKKRQASDSILAASQQQAHALLQHPCSVLQAQQQQGAAAAVAAECPDQQQAIASLPFQFTSNTNSGQQDQQSSQDGAGTGTQQSHQHSAQPKRRRGRPASCSSKVHPNLVYVRRFRERQKQMETDLEATVAQHKRQLQQLQLEQQQLCLKWEALEQVLLVQNNVLQLMQKLAIAQPPAADEDQQLQLFGHHKLATSAAAVAANGPTADAAAASNGPTATVSADTALQEADKAEDAELQQHTEAAAVAAAAIKASKQAAACEADPLRDRQLLLLQARHWLEPVRLYTLRAAIMLHQLGMLPLNTAATAALAAAQACPEATAPPKLLHGPQATAAAVKAAITAAAAQGSPAGAAMAAAAVAAAVKSSWDGSAAAAGRDEAQQQELSEVDGVPLVRYPYSIGMYVITPEPIKDLCWPMNMATWQVDDGNNQQHMEAAGRAMWAVISPERWRLLRATWLTMGNQLRQVQQDFVHLHDRLRTVGAKTVVSSSSGSSSNGVSTEAGAGAEAGSGSEASAYTQQHGLCLNGFASMEDSTAYEYAAAAVEVENVLMREDALSFQLCGAFLELLDPIEIAVGYVSSWPYHPQAFTIFDVLFKLGEPPEQGACATAQS